MLALSPYSESFMTRIAVASSGTRVTETTGPNVSSWAQSAVGGTWSRTVGA
ncbi:hypothetical protein D3C73_1576970 [compost metagenome]